MFYNTDIFDSSGSAVSPICTHIHTGKRFNGSHALATYMLNNFTFGIFHTHTQTRTHFDLVVYFAFPCVYECELCHSRALDNSNTHIIYIVDTFYTNKIDRFIHNIYNFSHSFEKRRHSE